MVFFFRSTFRALQEKNHSSYHFSERSQALANQLGVSLRDLADHVGISQAMLFGYRSGKYQPTLKAWRKLEDAERKAGIRPGEVTAESAPDPPVPAPIDQLIALNQQLAEMTRAHEEALARIAALQAQQTEALRQFAISQQALQEEIRPLREPKPSQGKAAS